MSTLQKYISLWQFVCQKKFIAETINFFCFKYYYEKKNVYDIITVNLVILWIK